MNLDNIWINNNIFHFIKTIFCIKINNVNDLKKHFKFYIFKKIYLKNMNVRLKYLPIQNTPISN